MGSPAALQRQKRRVPGLSTAPSPTVVPTAPVSVTGDKGLRLSVARSLWASLFEARAELTRDGCGTGQRSIRFCATPGARLMQRMGPLASYVPL